MCKVGIQRLIDKAPPSWLKMFKRYKLGRKPTVDQLIETVLEYTPTMRSSGARGAAKHKVPKAVKKEAMDGLKLAHKHNWTSASGVGLVRAMQLVVRPKIWDRSVERMNSYFTRHARDKESNAIKSGKQTWGPRKPSRGYIAHLVWGGDSGQKWASRQVMKTNPIVSKRTLTNPNQFNLDLQRQFEDTGERHEGTPILAQTFPNNCRVEFVVDRYNNTALIVYIQTIGKECFRKGYARTTMENILRIVDKHQLRTELSIEPFGRMNKSDLGRFYSSLGFEFSGEYDNFDAPIMLRNNPRNSLALEHDRTREKLGLTMLRKKPLTQKESRIVQAVQDAIANDLPKECKQTKEREEMYAKQRKTQPLAGRCSLATQAVWKLLGGLNKGNPKYVPLVIRAGEMGKNSDTHWFIIKLSDGKIIDPTSAQFGRKRIPYEKGQYDLGLLSQHLRTSLGTSQLMKEKGIWTPPKGTQKLLERIKLKRNPSIRMVPKEQVRMVGFTKYKTREVQREIPYVLGFIEEMRGEEMLFPTPIRAMTDAEFSRGRNTVDSGHPMGAGHGQINMNTNEIAINPRMGVKDLVANVFHENLHYAYPDWPEESVRDMTGEAMLNLYGEYILGRPFAEERKKNPRRRRNRKAGTRDSKGRFIPARYLSGYKGKKLKERIAEIEQRRDEYQAALDKYGDEDQFTQKVLRKLYRPFETDKGVKSKRSKYTQEAKKRGFVGSVNEKAKLASKYYGGFIDPKILDQVNDRGMAAWASGGHRPGQTPFSWGIARVNSFLVGGKTFWTSDADLVRQLPKDVALAIAENSILSPTLSVILA